jgi:hypothetical protein
MERNRGIKKRQRRYKQVEEYRDTGKIKRKHTSDEKEKEIRK